MFKENLDINYYLIAKTEIKWLVFIFLWNISVTQKCDIKGHVKEQFE